MQEIWKPVQGYESSYQVSNLGRVRSLDRTINYPANRRARAFSQNVRGTILKQFSQKTGYIYLMLRNGRDRSKKFLVHRLVATAFIDNPNGLPEVNHIDSAKSNNAASNLEWCSSRQNTIHAFRTGHMKPLRGSKSCLSILTEIQVLEIRRLLREGKSQRQIAEMFSVCISNISKIKTRATWTHI